MPLSDIPQFGYLILFTYRSLPLLRIGSLDSLCQSIALLQIAYLVFQLLVYQVMFLIVGIIVAYYVQSYAYKQSCRLSILRIEGVLIFSIFFYGFYRVNMPVAFSSVDSIFLYFVSPQGSMRRFMLFACFFLYIFQAAQQGVGFKVFPVVYRYANQNFQLLVSVSDAVLFLNLPKYVYVAYFGFAYAVNFLVPSVFYQGIAVRFYNNDLLFRIALTGFLLV